MLRSSPRRTTTGTRVLALRDGAARRRPDTLATEEPMEIRAGGPVQEPVQVAVTMRTPGNDFELAAGFLFTEGLIDGGEDIDSIALRSPRGGAGVQRGHGAALPPVRSRDARPQLLRHLLLRRVREGLAGPRGSALSGAPDRTRGGCVDRVRPARRAAARPADLRGNRRSARLGPLRRRPQPAGRPRGRRTSQRRGQGGGVGAARGRGPAVGSILQVSGRLSFEIVQKAAVAGVPIVCAVSAPSSLAVEAGERLGVTVAGFVRDGGLNVYSRPERIDPEG